MIRSSSRRTLAALALAAALLPSPAWAGPFDLARLAIEPGIFAQLYEAFTSIWGEAGGGLDPNGNTVDNGGGLDPDGRSSLEEGGGLDPNGR